MGASLPSYEVMHLTMQAGKEPGLLPADHAFLLPRLPGMHQHIELCRGTHQPHQAACRHLVSGWHALRLCRPVLGYAVRERNSCAKGLSAEGACLRVLPRTAQGNSRGRRLHRGRAAPLSYQAQPVSTSASPGLSANTAVVSGGRQLGRTGSADLHQAAVCRAWSERTITGMQHPCSWACQSLVLAFGEYQTQSRGCGLTCRVCRQQVLSTGPFLCLC